MIVRNTCNKTTHIIADIVDDYPSPDDIPDFSFPVVQADITECSTYAVVCRLKLSPAYTITVKGGTFIHPDYPDVMIAVPQKAVANKTKLPLKLKVGYDIFILHLSGIVAQWLGRVPWDLEIRVQDPF